MSDETNSGRTRNAASMNRLGVRIDPPVGATRQDPRSATPNGERLTRKRKQGVDSLYFDKALIPPGMSWEWKRESCFGAPDDSHMIGLKDNHWQVVANSKAPGVMTRQNGLVLMERPAYLTEEAYQDDYDISSQRLRNAVNQLSEGPPGQFSRANTASAAANTGVHTEFGVAIPE